MEAVVTLGRTVVDQICLVPDAQAFLEAIASWDERYFFPS